MKRLDVDRSRTASFNIPWGKPNAFGQLAISSCAFWAARLSILDRGRINPRPTSLVIGGKRSMGRYHNPFNSPFTVQVPPLNRPAPDLAQITVYSACHLVLQRGHPFAAMFLRALSSILAISPSPPIRLSIVSFLLRFVSMLRLTVNSSSNTGPIRLRLPWKGALVPRLRRARFVRFRFSVILALGKALSTPSTIGVALPRLRLECDFDAHRAFGDGGRSACVDKGLTAQRLPDSTLEPLNPNRFAQIRCPLGGGYEIRCRPGR